MTDPEPARPGALAGVACALAAAFLFTSSDTIVKVLSARYSIFQIIAMQAAFAAMPALVLLLRDGTLKRLRVNHPWRVAARGALGAFGAVLGFYAFSRLPLADVYAITFGAPIVVTIASIPLLGETVRLHRWAAVVTGFIGVLVMVRPGFETLSLGHLAALGTVFTSAGVVLILRAIGREEERGVMVLAVLVGLILVSWPTLPFTGRLPSWEDLGLVAAAGLIMGFAQVVNLEALRRAPAASVAPMQYTMLVWALFYGLAVFGDPVKSHVLAGAAIVIASSLYIMHRERVRGRTLRAHVKAG